MPIPTTILNIVFAIVMTMFCNLSIPTNSATVCTETDTDACSSSTNTDNLIWCMAHKSCSNKTFLEATHVSVKCDGSYSCCNTSSIISNSFQDCYGLSACSNVGFMESSHKVYCDSEIACLNTIINATGKLAESDVECDGYRACEGSVIRNFGHNIKSKGAFGTLNAYINVSDGSSIDSANTLSDIFMYGYYSGWNSTVRCKKGHTCNIYCDGSGCNNMKLECNTDDTGVCPIIDCSSSDINDICGVGNNNSNNNNTGNNIFGSAPFLNEVTPERLFQSMIRNVDSSYSSGGYDISTIANSFDICEGDKNNNSNNSNNITRVTLGGNYGDHYLDSVLNDAENGTICCGADKACFQSPSIKLSHSNSNAIRCDGLNSCRGATWALSKIEVSDNTTFGHGYMFCTGHKSCQEVFLIDASYNSSVIYCTGSTSCRRSNIINAYQLVCAAHEACQDTDISNIKDNVYILGENAMQGSSLNGIGGNIYCLSYTACQQVEIQDVEGSIYANGYHVLYESVIYGLKQDLYVTGYQALQFSIIQGSGDSVFYIQSDMGLDSAIIENFHNLTIIGIRALSNTYVYSGGSSSVEEETTDITNNSTDHEETDGTTSTTAAIVRKIIVIKNIDNSDNNTQNSYVFCNETDECEISYNSDENANLGICCEGWCEVRLSFNDENTEDEVVIIDKPWKSINCPFLPDSIDSNSLEKQIDKWIVISRWFLVILVVSTMLTIILSVTSFERGKSERKSFDMPDYFSILKVAQNFGDFWTDIFFSIILWLEKRFFLLLLSIVFIGVPYFMSCFVGIHTVGKWRLKSEKVGRRLQEYLQKYEKLIFGLMIFVGFYSAVDICRSKIFYIPMTNLSLKWSEHERLKFYRFGNILLLENLPQVVLQTLYVAYSNSFNEIAIVSMIFSVLSIILACVLRISECRYISNIKRKFRYKARIVGEYEIKCVNINAKHIYSNKSMAKCIYETLTKELGVALGERSNLLTVEVFYVEKFETSTDENKNTGQTNNKNDSNNNNNNTIRIESNNSKNNSIHMNESNSNSDKTKTLTGENSAHQQLNYHFEIKLFTYYEEDNFTLLRLLQTNVTSMGDVKSQIYKQFRANIIKRLFYSQIDNASQCQISLDGLKSGSRALHVEHYSKDRQRHLGSTDTIRSSTSSHTVCLVFHPFLSPLSFLIIA